MQEEQNKSTLEYVMHYGALLGLFWVFKYLFLIGEVYWVHFIYFYSLLNVVSPLLMYIFYLRYRHQTQEQHHNLWKCIVFVVGICFFGSIFEGAIQYAHYTFINPDLFANMSAVTVGMVEESMKMMQEKSIFNTVPESQIEEVKSIYLSLASSKFPYILVNMFRQVFIGFVFSFLIGVLTRNRNLNNPPK